MLKKDFIGKQQGYAFPYPVQQGHESSFITFAYVSYESARQIISMKSLLIKNYIKLLDKSCINKVQMNVEYISDSGLRLIEVDSMNYHHVTRGKKRKYTHCNDDKYSCLSDGLLIGLWKKCNTFSINDWCVLKDLLKQTFGEFGFKRSKSNCLGMNLYFGKKTAAYVRPTPKMSQLSSLESEYYREEFDPTFYPLIYKMVNQLTDQAEHFQKCCDPIYDRFLFDSLSRENPEIHQFPKQDGYNRNETKKYMQNRRFCALSIMTCGNSTISGFANEPHKDNDFITTSCYSSCHQTLKELHCEVTASQNEQLQKAFSHIEKRYKKNKKFSTYTTCGYKCKFTQS